MSNSKTPAKAENTAAEAANAPENATPAYEFDKYFAEKMAEAEEKIKSQMEEAAKTANEIIENAKAEAEKIVDGAKQPSELQGAEANIMDTDAYLEERVSVKLFKDNGKYSQDVFVSVNGENCVIKRGKTVLVKRKFALALSQSEAQDSYAADLKELYAREYEEKSRQYDKE